MKKVKLINLMTDEIRLGVLFFCMCFLLPVSAQTGQGNRITYKCSNEKLQRALMTVERQSGYYRLQYAMEDVAPYSVTANIKNASAEEAVRQLLRNTSLQYEMNGRFIQVYAKKQQASGRTRTVRGYVRDADGEALIGVPVCIGESRVCTVTDADGFYTFSIPVEETMLKFSYVGMETAYVRIPGGSRDVSRDVALRSDNVLEDVVVTGYQEIQKPKMTGAATTITADKLNDRYTTNIADNLEGRVAGLSTYGGRLTIRGTSSLYAESTPLLVVDGLPVEGDIKDINPYDIATVNVLKDAAATAIYGARASNGIIVITTKNANKNKIDIDFASNLTIYEKRNMNYSDNFYMTPEQQLVVETDYYDYYFFHNDGEIYDPIMSTMSDIESGKSISPLRYAYYQLANGEITQQQLDAIIAQLKNNNYAKEYGKKVLRQQVLQQYNLSLRSRTTNSQQNLVVNYKHDNLGMVHSRENQFNVQYKGIFNFAKWLTGTFTVNGIWGRSKGYTTDVAGSQFGPFSVPAYYSLLEPDGAYSWNNPQYGNAYSSYEKESGLRSMRYNPLEDIHNDLMQTRHQNMRYHANLLFTIIDGLTFNTQFVYETNNRSSREYASADSYKYRQMRNAYTTQANGKYSYLVPQTGGMLTTGNTDSDSWTWRGQTNYDKAFGRHAVNAVAGLEFRETKSRGINGLLLGYDEQMEVSSTATVDFNTLNNTEYAPYLYGGQYESRYMAYEAYIEKAMSPVAEQRHRYASGYFNLTYTYDDRYNVFGSFRKDYADVYGLNAKFRGKPLWSVGAAWNINNEAFMNDVAWVNSLKLRASYGVTGNIYQEATSYMTATIDGLNRFTNLPLSTVDSPANPNLKWEQTRTTNIGLDFSLLNNRLRGSLDWYHKKGMDIFSYMNLDPSNGFTSMFVNSANMKNDGIELSLTYDWMRSASREGLSWTTTYTMSYNKNKITRVDNDATTAFVLTQNPFKEGYPSSAMWSYRFAGIDAETYPGMTMWYNDKGEKVRWAMSSGIDALVFSGQSEPKYVMGMDNTLRYQGFSLSVLMAYYGGHQMRALCENEMYGLQTQAIPSYFLNAWTKDHPTNTPGIGRYSATTTSTETMFSDISVKDADFLKIRNISLGYEFPHHWLGSLGINSLSLRLQINNPKYLWVKNGDGVDPETLGVRNPSSYVFGININI